MFLITKTSYDNLTHCKIYVILLFEQIKKEGRIYCIKKNVMYFGRLWTKTSIQQFLVRVVRDLQLACELRSKIDLRFDLTKRLETKHQTLYLQL